MFDRFAEQVVIRVKWSGNSRNNDGNLPFSHFPPIVPKKKSDAKKKVASKKVPVRVLLCNLQYLHEFNPFQQRHKQTLSSSVVATILNSL